MGPPAADEKTAVTGDSDEQDENLVDVVTRPITRVADGLGRLLKSIFD